jgi:transitional endoplasmic reticulum ATPase
MSDAESGRTLKLTVRAAEKRDAGRGIARLSGRAREALGILSGDTVRIRGGTSTVVQVWPADRNADAEAIQIDADTRRNADVTVGEPVTVERIDVKSAETVTVSVDAPVETDQRTVGDAVRRELRDRPVRTAERLRIERLGGVPLTVQETTPKGAVKITDDTVLEVEITDAGNDAEGDTAEAGTDRSGTDRNEQTADRPDETETGSRDRATEDVSSAETDPETATRSRVSYEDIGGLDEELELIRETIELPLSEPEAFTRVGVEPPKGVLLHGPPGTGKTLIAKAVANEIDANFQTVSGPEIMSKYKGESEQKLRDVFERARADAPTVIFFDEIDSIAAEREEGGDAESRIVGQLLSLMDGLKGRGNVVVIGATNRPDTLDPALRRGGRFDREIEIGVPDESGRREILAVHTRGVPLSDEVNLDRIAARTHGFVGADMDTLVTEAAMAALRRARRAGDSLSGVTVTRTDLGEAMAAVEPSAMREHVAEKPTQGFEAIGGLDDAKTTLRRTVEWPLEHGPLFEAAGTEPPTGVLLYGPPGTGKTLLARAIAAESGVNFVSVAGPELLDRYVGESERAVREVFERARQASPAILFFDEIDGVATARGGDSGDSGVGERVVSQLLTELDGLADNPNLAVLAATNRKDALDPALLRPGRLETHIEVPAPNEEGRREILAVHTREVPLADGVDLDRLADDTAGYSGADLQAVCREAAMRAVSTVAEQHGDEANAHAEEVVVTPEDIEAARATIEPSLA